MIISFVGKAGYKLLSGTCFGIFVGLVVNKISAGSGVIQGVVPGLSFLVGFFYQFEPFVALFERIILQGEEYEVFKC